jgi:nucleotide-binding universal stress UspA family protein
MMIAGGVALTPLDGSPTAEAVVPWVRALARVLRLRIVLVMVEPEDRDTARRYLDGIAAALGESIQIDRRVVSGEDVAARLLELADEEDAELILLATHGRSGFDRWRLGSVADELVRASTRPVLVIRAGAAAAPTADVRLARILVPLDGYAEAEAALAPARAIAAGGQAIIDLVHVVPEMWSAVAGIAAGAARQLDAAAGDYLDHVRTRLVSDVSAESHVLHGSTATALLDYAESSGADLIAMSTHGRGGVARWALGSVADRVLHGTTHPLLLVRPDPARLRGGGLFAVEGEPGRP